MKTNDTDTARFPSVLASESDVFSDIVELSGLRPDSDFRHSRLAEVDFEGSHLSAFNFDYADLRRAKWGNRQSDPNSLRYSLRGGGKNEVRGSDFNDLKIQVLSKSRWAERFFAFRILVDNWGENSDTADILAQLLSEDTGTYLRLCCFVYFSASFLNDHKSKSLCVDMANAGRSQVNIFRLKKLRRSAKNSLNYFESVHSRERYPNDLSQDDIGSLRRRIDGLLESSEHKRVFEQ